ncbi:hypothetical protein HHK36_027939 [Tetracentron sinense]|uniref:Cytochrome P450 n=1 Tax=Tetracentron sinense TaxID=13715 RepID=A0A835D1I1_TETSI|nr:hypothetical protein HHK36_027939 [Tetracentron sinense]
MRHALHNLTPKWAIPLRIPNDAIDVNLAVERYRLRSVVIWEVDMISELAYKLVGMVFKGWEGANKEDKLTPAILAVLSVATLAIFGYLWTSKISRNGTVAPLPLGPIMKLRLGNTLSVVLSSASLAKEIFRDHGIAFANRDRTIAALVMTHGGIDITWSPYGPYWRMLRKVCVHEMLSNSSLDASYALRRHEVRKTLRDVYAKIHTPIIIWDLGFLTELEVMMSMLWGGTLEGVASSLGKPNISDLFPILAPFDIQGIERQMKKLWLWFDRIFDPIIDDRLKLINGEKGEQTSNNKGNKDFLQFLLRLDEQQEDIERPLTRMEMKALLLWKLPKDTQLDLTEKFGVVLNKKIPLVVIPTPGLSNLEVYA